MKYNLAKTESLEINGDVYVKGIGTYNGSNAGENDVKTLSEVLNTASGMIEVTWSNLVNLRNNSNLIPGAQYRIIDYVTSTIAENTQSAGHPFDIIVTADSVNILNENARAVQHNGDEYFSNSDLSSWELKYCLDNDTSRFGWVSPNIGSIIAGEGPDEDIFEPDGYNYNVPENQFTYTGTFTYNEQTYYQWTCDGDETVSVLTTERDYTNNNLKINNNNFSITPKIVAYLRNDETYTNHDANLTYIVDGDSGHIWIDHFYISYSTGVIYYMKDEYGNECPYDFKNIQFKRYKVTRFNGSGGGDVKTSLVYDIEGNPKYYGCLDIFGYEIPNNFTLDTSSFIWYYTFSGLDSNKNVYDMSSHPFELSQSTITTIIDNGEGTNIMDRCDDNIISPLMQEYFGDDVHFKGRQILNNIVFVGDVSYDDGYDNGYSISSIYGNKFGVDCRDNTFGNYCYYNTFGNNCYGNTFGNNCYGNTFGNNCYYNTFGNNCDSNTFGNNCSSNTFGNNCYYNTFGNYCDSNTFGNNCYKNTFGNEFYSNTFGNNCDSNTFGNNCYYNTFGNNCYYNTFGNNCDSNTFGNYCDSNTFGNNCYDNTFGNNCGSNTFGNYCYYNTFGNNCYYNTFGNNCYRNTFGNYIQESQFGDGVQYFAITSSDTTSKPSSTGLKSYVRWLIIENGIRYVNAYVSGSTSSNSYCQNVKICQGCSGVSDSKRKSFEINNNGATSQLIVCYDTSGNLQTGNLGNLLATLTI